MHVGAFYLTSVAFLRILDDVGRGGLVGGDIFNDQVSKVEVVGSVPGILIAVAGGGEADIAAVVGTESIPQRVVDPFVAWPAVVYVGDFRLLVERDAGLALVGGGLVSSSADGESLVDGLAHEAGSFEPYIHEGSPGCAAETAKDELAELMDGDGGAGAIAVVEVVLVAGSHRAFWVAELVLAFLPLEGRQRLLSEVVVVAEGDPSHPILIGFSSACSSSGRSLDNAVYALGDEAVQVHAVGAEREVAIVTVVPLLVPDARGVQALPGDL